MKILAIQLKRIGDLVLTTPALSSLREAGARVSLLVDSGCRSLLPGIRDVDEKLVHNKRGSNRPLWRRLRAGGWDAVLDFTGSDRSAVMTWRTRSPRGVTFEWVRSRWWKRLVYHAYVDSPVRLAHTCDHYLDLAVACEAKRPEKPEPHLDLPSNAIPSAARLLEPATLPERYIVLHPGTARPEKYWAPERWAAVVANLTKRGEHAIITCGPDNFEERHARSIILELGKIEPGLTSKVPVVTPPDLLTFAALIKGARAVLSCDTSAVHLAAAFQRPQIALFGPTNPFHWRPRHDHALVLSAASPNTPLTEFQPKMKGAPMEQLPVQLVQASVSRLLSHSS